MAWGSLIVPVPMLGTRFGLESLGLKPGKSIVIDPWRVRSKRVHSEDLQDGVFSSRQNEHYSQSISFLTGKGKSELHGVMHHGYVAYSINPYVKCNDA